MKILILAQGSKNQVPFNQKKNSKNLLGEILNFIAPPKQKYIKFLIFPEFYRQYKPNLLHLSESVKKTRKMILDAT